MGMILGFFLFMYILVSVAIYRLTKRKTTNKWKHRIVLSILILIPTYDIIITNFLAEYYCLTTPHTHISKKVQYPESIYWENNIFGGFDASERKLMTRNYLDGVHLKTMALNGDDGKVYVYYYENISTEYYLLRNEFNISSKKYTQCKNDLHVAHDSKDLNLKEIKKKCAKLSDKVSRLYLKINETIETFTKEKVYDKSSMPSMNYTVIFNKVKLNLFVKNFLYSNETKIIDNKNNEIIAYKRQYMPFFYNITLGDKWNKGSYYSRWAWETCGWHQSGTQYFFTHVFENIDRNSGSIAQSFNNKLYGENKTNLPDILILTPIF